MEIKRQIIEFLINSGNQLPSDLSWFDVGVKFGIQPPDTERASRSEEYRRKSIATKTQDIWRNHIKQKNDLELTKETYRYGELQYETFKKVPAPTEPVNTEKYELEAITTNPHGGEWKKFKLKKEHQENTEEVFDRLFDKYAGLPLEPIYTPIDRTPSDMIGVLNLYDAHIDKIPIKSTSGKEGSIKENIEIFKRTVERIIPHIQENNLKRVVLPIGNDLFHTNGFNDKTKKGTEIEYFGSPEEAYYVISDLVIDTITSIANVVPYLDVVMIKGNHDEDKITTLGYWIDKMFRNSDRVLVNSTRQQRKYYHYGENLIGFAHGDKEKNKIYQIPLLMAQEAKEIWGQTTHRKMYLGDLHHGFEFQFLKSKDMPGVEVEFLRSIGTTDSFHEDFGYVGIPKTAYLQVFDKYDGEFNRYKFNIK